MIQKPSVMEVFDGLILKTVLSFSGKDISFPLVNRAFNTIFKKYITIEHDDIRKSILLYQDRSFDFMMTRKDEFFEYNKNNCMVCLSIMFNNIHACSSLLKIDEIKPCKECYYYALHNTCYHNNRSGEAFLCLLSQKNEEELLKRIDPFEIVLEKQEHTLTFIINKSNIFHLFVDKIIFHLTERQNEESITWNEGFSIVFNSQFIQEYHFRDAIIYAWKHACNVFVLQKLLLYKRFDPSMENNCLLRYIIRTQNTKRNNNNNEDMIELFVLLLIKDERVDPLVMDCGLLYIAMKFGWYYVFEYIMDVLMLKEDNALKIKMNLPFAILETVSFLNGYYKEIEYRNIILKSARHLSSKRLHELIMYIYQNKISCGEILQDTFFTLITLPQLDPAMNNLELIKFFFENSKLMKKNQQLFLLKLCEYPHVDLQCNQGELFFKIQNNKQLLKRLFDIIIKKGEDIISSLIPLYNGKK